jgi:hypothetical protein
LALPFGLQQEAAGIQGTLKASSDGRFHLGVLGVDLGSELR